MADNPFLRAFGMLNPTPPPPEDEPYFASLGRFVTAYSQAEGYILELARALSRLSDAKARVIFGGMRIGDLSERVRALMHVTKRSATFYQNIDACLTQLDVISTQRNKVAHRLVNYSKKHKAIFVTNLMTARSVDLTQIDLFSLHDFDNMASDCLAITMRLIHAANSKERKKTDRETLKWAHQAWRYKPAPPKTRQKQHQQAPQSPARQLGASQK